MGVFVAVVGRVFMKKSLQMEIIDGVQLEVSRRLLRVGPPLRQAMAAEVTYSGTGVRRAVCC